VKGVIEKLIRQELEKSEKEFMELFRATERRKMTQKEFRNRSGGKLC